MQPETPSTALAVEDEISALDDMAKAIAAMLPVPDSRLAAWRQQAAKLAEERELCDLAQERAVDDLALALRSAWLRAAHDSSHGYLMAPLHEETKTMPSGERFQFDYERSSRPETLERRGLAMAPPPPGWAGKCMLFSSGMSAIATLVQVCCAHLKGAIPDTPVNLNMFGGYFETWRLLDMFHNPFLEVAYISNNDDLAASLASGAVDAVVIEPVAYDWAMTVFDLSAFAEAWANAPEVPRVVIVDTSLTGPSFHMATLVEAFGQRLPWTVVFVRSGLKLDQEGLELSNVGVANVYVPDQREAPINFQHLLQRLTVNRAVTGGGLSVNATAALEAPWFLSATHYAGHAARVFANNARLAAEVQNTGGIFSRINHPARVEGEHTAWAVSPFVVFHLHEDSATRHGLLVAILVQEARTRGLCLDLGSSFGFRGHRFEVIRPLVQIREWQGRTGLLKIAMGARQGPSVEGIVALMNELAAFPDWDALKAAYPDVKPYVKGGYGVYVEKPPRP